MIAVTACLVLPLAAALAAIPLGRRAPRLALVAAPLILLAALAVATEIWRTGPAQLPVGGWLPPLGIALVVDGLSAAFLLTGAIVTGAVVLFATSIFSTPDRETRAGFAFWPLLLAMWGALNAVFLSGDLFNLYVALELLTLTAVALVALDGRRETVAAAIRYMLFALFGSLAYLLGVTLIYARYGALDIALLRILAEPDAPTFVAAALMTIGLAAKTALFPFHAWLPPAHAGAPAPASAMLSALVTKASFYIVVRIWFDVLPVAGNEALAMILGAMGVGAILFGSVLAIGQERLKLVVAYSTVAQLGYLFLMFPLAGSGGEAQPWAAGAWNGGVVHALSHAFAKAAMFLCAGLFAEAIGHDRMDGLKGVARTMPLTVFAFGLAAISLMGLPPSGGFTAKYLLLTAAFAGGNHFFALVMLAGGLLAAIYLFRPLERAFAKPAEGSDITPIARWRQAVPLVLAGAAIALGVFSAVPFDLLRIGRADAAQEGLE
ncbi:MAG: NADH-quinone oxidoreductase subunit J [Salinarimonadaceae bacterium]|nr:MAG: NADH-quinone oxidoreductase subunit J [Salinarimonadaceae bacterium]